jgi:deoxyribodipyrimidine photo-lyase
MALFALWCKGKTGFPIVDAAMRQMHEMGWMHNRLRMVTAMFLSKILLIDWRYGERYFMQHLIDGDLSANNGGWQWSASTGTDAVPYFRIFNPTTQSQKFDPDGLFIKRYCKELKNLDKKTVHQPYAKALELVKHLSYPKPIVDYKKAREQALSLYKGI